MEPLSLRVDLEQALESGARLGAVVFEGGVERLALDPVGRYPLASVRKVVTLGGYAVAVASGMCDPAEPVALRDIEREWARLMAALAAGTGLPNAGRIVREALERPSTPGDDGRFGAKAGDLPGILTFAGYVRARSRGAPDIAVAMFLSGQDPERLHRLSAALPQTPSQSLELARVLAALR